MYIIYLGIWGNAGLLTDHWNGMVALESRIRVAYGFHTNLLTNDPVLYGRRVEAPVPLWDVDSRFQLGCAALRGSCCGYCCVFH